MILLSISISIAEETEETEKTEKNESTKKYILEEECKRNITQVDSTLKENIVLGLWGNDTIWYRKIRVIKNISDSLNFHITIRPDIEIDIKCDDYKITEDNLEFDGFDGTLKSKAIAYGKLRMLNIPKSLKAGEYTGTITLKVEKCDKTDEYNIPVNIKIKSSIWLAILCILIGCIIRHLVRILNALLEEANVRVKYDKLKQNIHNRADLSYGAACLQKELDNIWNTYRAKKNREKANKELNKFKKWLKVAEIEHILQLKDKIAQIKDNKTREEQELKNIYKTLMTKANVNIDIAVNQANDELYKLEKDIKLKENPKLEPTQTISKKKPILLRPVLRLLGLSSWGTNPQLLIQIIIYIIGFIILLYTGLTSQYEPDNTWGANGWQDYAGLVVWAYTSDWVSKSISEILKKLASS